MALVTYILLSALHSGVAGKFNPALFGSLASRAIGVLLLDFFFVRLGCYLLGVQTGSGGGGTADLVAYGGYKFVGVILTLLAGMMGAGMTLYSAVFLYAFMANAFFLVSVFSLFTLRCSPSHVFLSPASIALNLHLPAAPFPALGRPPRRDQLLGHGESLAAQEAHHVPLPRGGHANLIYGHSRPDLRRWSGY